MSIVDFSVLYAYWISDVVRLRMSIVLFDRITAQILYIRLMRVIGL